MGFALEASNRIGMENELMALKQGDWSKRDRSSKLANIMYPAHASEDVQKEMTSLAANEKRKPPQRQALLSDADRGCVSPLGNLAQPLTRKGKA
jgi:hypothetical protein